MSASVHSYFKQTLLSQGQLGGQLPSTNNNSKGVDSLSHLKTTDSCDDYDEFLSQSDD